jgi:hypothetical protein
MNHTFFFFLFSISLTAQPVEVSLWTDEFPQPDQVEDKADAKIFIHHPANPNGTAAIICPNLVNHPPKTLSSGFPAALILQFLYTPW